MSKEEQEEIDTMDTKKTAASLKFMSLAVMVVQMTFLVLLLRYSRVMGSQYMTSTAVFLAELLKLFACLVIVFRNHSMDLSARESFGEMMYGHLVDKWDETLKLAVPAGLYALQNNMLFFAISNLDSATYQVTYQLKVLTTALFSVALLGKKLSTRQWGSLVLLMVGVSMVQLTLSQPAAVVKVANLQPTDAPALETARRLLGEDVMLVQKPFLGVMAVLASACTSGFAGVYFEKMLKGSTTSVWIRNIQLSIWGALSSFILICINNGGDVLEKGFFYGYSPLVVVVVLNQGLSGLIVAMVVKYADNIIKSFGNALSIILGSVLSIFIFDFHLTPMFAAGGLLVVVAGFIYGLPPRETKLGGGRV